MNLKHLQLFKDLNWREIKEIKKISKVKNFKKEEIIFRLGEKREFFFVILKGQVSLYVDFNHNRELLNMEDKGNFLSELSLIDCKSKHEITALAQEKCELLVISAKLFRKLSSKNLLLVNKILSNIIEANSLDIYHARNRLLAVYDIGKIVSKKHHQFPQTAQRVLEVLLLTIHAQKALFVLYGEENKEAEIIASRGFKEKEEILNSKIKIKDEPVIGEIFQTSKLVNLSGNDYLLSSKKVNYVKSSVLAMPIIINQKVAAGIILIDKKNDHQFNANNELLLSLVSQVLKGTIKEILDEIKHKAEEELKRVYVEPI